MDLARCDGLSLVVTSKTSSFLGNTLEDVVDEGVHDGHGLVGDTSIGVYLLENLVDEGGVRVVVSLTGSSLGVNLLGDLLDLLLGLWRETGVSTGRAKEDHEAKLRTSAAAAPEAGTFFPARGIVVFRDDSN